MRRAISLAGLIVVFVSFSLPAGAASGSPVFPPGSHPAGSSYEEWAGRFAIWFQEIPVDENPFVDPSSPENCAVQDGGVVFVGAVGADCSIPAGSPILVSPIGFECSTAEGLGDTFAELRRCAVENFKQISSPDTLRMRLKVDGERVPHLRKWTFVSPGEIVDLPEDNLWGVEPGPTKSVTKAFSLMVRPFFDGTHKVVVTGEDQFIGRFRFVWRFRVAPYGS